MCKKLVTSGIGIVALCVLPLLASATSCPNLTRTLSFGSRGAEVVELQNFLIAQGDLAAGNNTGNFFSLTEAAVQKFQCRQNIVCSGTPASTGWGVVGPRTRAAIANVCATVTTSAPVNTASQGNGSSVPSGANQTTPNSESTLSLSNDLITTTHRYDSAHMFGGWGPHLGHLLRDASGILWFADDSGNNVNYNSQITYHHLIGGQWTVAGTQATYGTVQQNMGSLLVGDYIYSYGIDIEHHRVEECYFSILKDYKACNLMPFDTGLSANYIGAVLSPSGSTRIVWWTNVANGAGTFSYIFNTNNSGWNGPFTTTVGGYNSLEHVTAAFLSDTQMRFLGQGVVGTAPNWTYATLYGSLTLGVPIKLITSINGADGVSQTSGQDIYIDDTGATHLLFRSYGTTTDMLYEYVSAEGQFSKPIVIDSNAPYGRLIPTPTALYLVDAPEAGSITIRSIPFSSIKGTIDWLHASRQTYLSEQFDAIYPESHNYQFAIVPTLDFAVNPSASQGEIYQITDAGDSLSSTASCIFNGQTIQHGQAVTAYQSSSVAYGQQCTAQQRTCNNGVLFGSYSYASCVAGSAPSVTLSTMSSVYNRGGLDIQGTWMNGARADITDWIGIVVANGSWGSVPAVGDGKTWVWATTNSQTQGTASGQAQGSATFAPLMPAGQYQLVYFLSQKDGGSNYIEKARSNVFTVQ